jgi:hypothetical protein
MTEHDAKRKDTKKATVGNHNRKARASKKMGPAV